MLRALATTALVSLALTACGPARGPDRPGGTDDGGNLHTVAPTEGATEGGSEGASEGQEQAGVGRDGGGGGGEPDGGDAGSGGGDGAPPASEPPAASHTPMEDLGGVGANGRAYLRPDRPGLVLEIDVQEGVRPSDEAVAHLRAIIEQVTRKQVRLTGGDTFASDRDAWSRDDLRAAAQQHRDHYSNDATMVLYLLYVEGGFHRDGEQTSAIGVTYNASEIALFPDRWSGIGNLVGTDRGIERAVLVHELGHALGLVNLTYRSDIDHEDPEHPGHSSNRGSVMFWAVETTLIGQVFDGPPPATFDDADMADIDGLREGRY